MNWAKTSILFSLCCWVAPCWGTIPAPFLSTEQLGGVRQGSGTSENGQEGGTHANQLPTPGNRHSEPDALGSIAQEVVPYPKSEVKVDWVRGTDFSKCKTYAWGTSRQMTPDQKHTIEGIIEATLRSKGLKKVGMDANPDLIVAFSGGNKLVYPIQGYLKNPLVKQGTLVVELADPQLKKAVWWGIADDTLTDNPDKYVALIQKKVSKMFEKYPPPTKK